MKTTTTSPATQELTYHPQADFEGAGLRCRCCSTVKPEQEFRRRWRDRDVRVRQCRCCHNLAEGLRRSAGRAATRNRSLRKAITRLRHAASPRLFAKICGNLVSDFGGPERFLAAWRDCLQRDLSRGGFAAFRHFDCVVRLAEFCESNRPNYGCWTDEQIESAIAAFGSAQQDET